MVILVISIVVLLCVVISSTVSLVLYKNPNRLFVFGPLYVIRRDNGKKGDPIVTKGFMRGTSPPWYTGTGIQVRFNKTVLQGGLCKKGTQKDEDQGILAAMGGRYMDVTAQDIREW